MLVAASVCSAGTAVEGVLALATMPVQVEVVQAPREVTWAAANSEREARD